MMTSDDKVGGWVKKGQNHDDVILECPLSVTDTQMQYLATNFRQDLGFHHPPDDRDAFEGV